MTGTLHILHGLLGTGKSTYAKERRKRGRAIILNNDEWMVRLYGENPPADSFQQFRNKFEQIQWQLACELLNEGIDVIWDYGASTRGELSLGKRPTSAACESLYTR